jgi:hypothetical protein
VKGVVTVFRIEANFDVIFVTSVPVEDALYLPAEVAFDFENQASDPLDLDWVI